MNLWAIEAGGNYGGGVAFVAAETMTRAKELAAGITPNTAWNIRWGKPDDVVLLRGDFSGHEGVLHHYGTGE